VLRKSSYLVGLVSLLSLALLTVLVGCSGHTGGVPRVAPQDSLLGQPPVAASLEAGEDDGVVVPLDFPDEPIEYQGAGPEGAKWPACHPGEGPTISALEVQGMDGTSIDVAAPGQFVRLVIYYSLPTDQGVIRHYTLSPYHYSMRNKRAPASQGAHTAYRTFKIPSDAAPCIATFSATVSGEHGTASAKMDFAVDGPPKSVGPDILNVWVSADEEAGDPPGPHDPPFVAQRGQVVRLYVRYYLEQRMRITRRYEIPGLEYAGDVPAARRGMGFHRTYKQLVIPPNAQPGGAALTVSMANDQGVTSELTSPPFEISSQVVSPPALAAIRLRAIDDRGRPQHTFKPGEKVGLLLEYDVPADMLVARDFAIPELGYSRHRAPIWKYRGSQRRSWVYYAIPDDLEQPSTHMEYDWDGAAEPVGGTSVGGTGTFAITVPPGH